MKNKFQTINIEDGMPTVSFALKRLDEELKAVKKLKLTAVKIIHGYGSTGVGGKLKKAIRKNLLQRQEEGKIKFFVTGEEWSIFNQYTREIITSCQGLSKDSDLDRLNLGITVVLL